MPKWLSKFVELNPVLIRGLLVAVAALLAQVLGHTVIEEELIDTVIDLLTAFAALITALWARGKVIAENKVIAWKLDPSDPDTIVPGPATARSTDEVTELVSAARVSQTQQEVRSELAAA